jgi:hypothetical protein
MPKAGQRSNPEDQISMCKFSKSNNLGQRSIVVKVQILKVKGQIMYAKAKFRAKVKS